MKIFKWLASIVIATALLTTACAKTAAVPTSPELTTSTPSPQVRLAAKEAYDIERRIQREFAHLKIRGEWFKETNELLEFINDIAIDEIITED